MDSVECDRLKGNLGGMLKSGGISPTLFRLRGSNRNVNSQCPIGYHYLHAGQPYPGATSRWTSSFSHPIIQAIITGSPQISLPKLPNMHALLDPARAAHDPNRQNKNNSPGKCNGKFSFNAVTTKGINRSGASKRLQLLTRFALSRDLKPFLL